MAFNIKADFLEGRDTSGFRGLVIQLIESGALEVQARRRYRHRLSMHAVPLHYVAVVGRKRRRGGRFTRAT